MRVAGVIVLYNPLDSFIDNILSCLDQLEVLYVVDNSDVKNSRVELMLNSVSDRIVYVDMGFNEGVARALNTGARMALKNGCTWLLTLDQDTRLHEGYVQSLLKFSTVFPVTGMMAPIYKKSADKGSLVTPVKFALTSGSMLHLPAYRETGPFKDELFIDHIDHEYGLRLNSKGYKVVRVNSVFLNHRPGMARAVRVLGFKIKYVTHSPLRNYYFIRNGFYVANLYRKEFPFFYLFFLSKVFKNVIKTFFFEEEKKQRRRMMWKGYVDYRTGTLGPFIKS